MTNREKFTEIFGCEIAQHDNGEAIPGHCKILIASDRHFNDWLKQEYVPPAQPFHNITMDDVLKYIDDMPEDVWQEFTACLECRGWELQRRTAKWCGGEFA